MSRHEISVVDSAVESAKQRYRRARLRAISDMGVSIVSEMRMSADAGLEAFRRDVFFTTFNYLFAVFTVLLPLMVLRALHTNPLMIVPAVAVYLALVIGYVRRRQMTSAAIAGLMLVVLYLLGTMGLIMTGIGGLHFLAYALIVIATPLAFGPRTAAVVALVCAGTYALVALLVAKGIVTFSPHASEYFVSMGNWVHNGLFFAGFAVVTVVISGRMYGKVGELVRSEVARSQMLKSSNSQLEDANERLRVMNEQLESRIAERTQRLETANRELESFSYTVSHDLRSPLQVIEGFSSLALQEEPAISGKSREYVQRIQVGARRMHDMIDDLLKFSQLASAPAQLQEVNLSGIAATIAHDLRATDPGRAVQFDIEADMRAAVDPGLIRNVLHNLLANAWKFTAKTPDARIEFGTRMELGERVHFVRDNGVGFDAKRAERLFQPFVRLHDSRDFTGSGVGLATTRRIIERHGGRIWARSSAGEGATFFFTLQKNVVDRAI